MASSSKISQLTAPKIIDQTKPFPPDGYVTVMGPDDQRYLVPEFMVPALHQTFEGYRKKRDLEVFSAAGAVSYPLHYNIPFLSSALWPSASATVGHGHSRTQPQSVTATVGHGHSRTWPDRITETFSQIHEFNSDVFGVIGEGKVMAPTIPVGHF